MRTWITAITCAAALWAACSLPAQAQRFRRNHSYDPYPNGPYSYGPYSPYAYPVPIPEDRYASRRTFDYGFDRITARLRQLDQRLWYLYRNQYLSAEDYYATLELLQPVWFDVLYGQGVRRGQYLETLRYLDDVERQINSLSRSYRTDWRRYRYSPY